MALSPLVALKNVGRRVAELRVERGLTQQELADRLDVSARYVQSIEAGRVNVTVRALVEIASVVRQPLAALFEAPHSNAPKPGRPRKR